LPDRYSSDRILPSSTSIMAATDAIGFDLDTAAARDQRAFGTSGDGRIA
jgi:hypothetical protein